MTIKTVVHLVDDTTAGGVMRMLQHLLDQPSLERSVHQSVKLVRRGAGALGRIEADVIVSHLTINWRGLPGLIALRAMNPTARLVHVEHSYTRAFTALNVPRKARFFALLRVAYSLFDTVVSVSQAQTNWLAERRLVRDAALRMIHPEVDLTPFAHLPQPMQPPRVIGAIGRLHRQKGFDILIKAFRQVSAPDARLLIFGEGEERERLEALAEGDLRIEFRGYAEKPEAAYAQVDLVAVPSRWEAFGIVVREAKAAARPILMSQVDGLNDQVFQNSQSVASCDVTAWARALRQALTAETRLEGPAPMIHDHAGTGFAAQWLEVLDPAPERGLLVLQANEA